MFCYTRLCPLIPLSLLVYQNFYAFLVSYVRDKYTVSLILRFDPSVMVINSFIVLSVLIMSVASSTARSPQSAI
jgi:hypothetical protein